MLRLTMWMNMPSFYQDDLFNGLVASGEVDLRVIFARKLTADRVQLGWKQEMKDYPHRTLSSGMAQAQWEAVRTAWSERSRLHVVNGIWAEPSFAAALCALAAAGSRFVVYAEAPDPRQPISSIGKLLRKSFGGWVARRAMGILAVAHFAERFYSQLGFDGERVYPFGYFRANNESCDATRMTCANRTEVVFVGQLIQRKGADLLLEAMQTLFGEYPDLVLSVIGDGSEARSLRDKARTLGIADQVNFEGAMSSDVIQSRLACAEVLVLPSRWDGWGMVVNEALSQGVPVIASDRCGAADLIQHGVNGFVFRSEDVQDLRECLRAFLDAPDNRSVMRAAAANSGRAVSAEAAARYLIECLKHITGATGARPTPPWLQRSVVPGSEVLENRL